MKISLLLLFILFAISTKAQQGTFLKVFTGNSYEEGIKSFRLPNKTYRIVGNTGTFGWGQKNIWLIALDSSGNFMWHKTYGKGGLDFAEDAQMDKYGNIFIVGSSSSQTQNSYQMLLVGVDTNGYAFTYTYFGGTNWDFGNGIQLISDSTLILVGETYSYASSKSNAWIIKAKTTGEEIWSSSVGGKKHESFYSIKQLPDSSYICAGYSNSYGNESKDAMLYCCSNNGDSIWLTTYKDTTDGEFYDLMINSDTNIIAVGYQTDTSDTYKDINMMSYNTKGQLLWNRVSLRQNDEVYYKSIISEGDNYIVSGLNSHYSLGEQDIYGCRIDHGGWWLASFSIGGKKEDYSNTIVKDTSNQELHYLLTGTTRSYGLNFSGAIIIRLDSNFHADTTRSIFIPSSIFSAKNINKLTLQVYPNPCTENVNIIIPDKARNKESVISIYNTFGELISQKKIKKGETHLKINLKNRPKSTYFVILRNSTTTYSSILLKD